MTSGLRNPGAAVRGVAAAALAVEALVMLLAIAPLAKIAGPDAGPAIWLRGTPSTGPGGVRVGCTAPALATGGPSPRA